jgi:hypothetical protein
LENETSGGVAIFFCPFCHDQFPPDLAAFFNQTLEQEFDIKAENFEREKKLGRVPAEFFTDKWWLKRRKYPIFPTKKLNSVQRMQQTIYEADFYSNEEKALRYRQFLEKRLERQKSLDVICCVDLWEGIYDYLYCSKHTSDTCSDSLILYEPEKRRFSLKNMSSSFLADKYYKYIPKRLLYFQIYCCPECGKNFPKSLASEWFEVVTKQFGITDIYNKKQLAKLPPKFLTGDWWRERGL